MSTATLNTTAAEYKVADIGLADWGRKEIKSPRRRCPA